MTGKFTEACRQSPPPKKELSRTVSEQKSGSCLSRVSCGRLNQGHGYPSQTFHPGMWTTIIFIQRTHTLPFDSFIADTEYVNYTMIKKKKNG